VLCAASIEEGVQDSCEDGQRLGDAEYSMLPRATRDANAARKSRKGRASGRTMEIQRLIGRSMRSIVDLPALGERSIILDCDVLQATAERARPRSQAPISHSRLRCGSS